MLEIMNREHKSKNTETVQILDSIDKIESFLNDVKHLFKNKDRIYAGLDFEFDMDFKLKKHVLSLGQLIFTTISDNGSITNHTPVLYDLRLFTNKQKQKYIDDILVNDRIVKILHGSESLDLHALRSVIDNDDKFKLFLKTVVDTRFLCETYNILKAKQTTDLKKSKPRCTIYSALLDTGAITQEQYESLASIKINYNKPWKIRNLSEKQIIYAAADVLFLHNLASVYIKSLGTELVDIIMESYSYALMIRMDILKSNKRKTSDALEKLRKNGILHKVLASSPMGLFMLNDLIQIDYLRKPAINIAYDTYISN